MGTIELKPTERLDDLQTVSRTLYENGLIPVTLHVHEADLESYYMNLAGDDNVEHDQIRAADMPS